MPFFSASQECLCLLLFVASFPSPTEQITQAHLEVHNRPHRVCPQEPVFITCTTNESSIIWTHSVDNNFAIVFLEQDPVPTVEHKGQLKIQLDSTQPLTSHIKIPYSGGLNGSTFTCTDGGSPPSESTVTYELAGNPPAPTTLTSKFLSDQYARLEWTATAFTTYYVIHMSPPQEDSTEKIMTNDTTITIGYVEGMNVSVWSVNECHMTSLKPNSILITKSKASWTEWFLMKSSIIIVVLCGAITVEHVGGGIILIVIACLCKWWKRRRRSKDAEKNE